MRKKLHDFDKMLEDETRRVKAEKTSAKNRKLILQYNDFNFSRGLSKARVIRNSISLRMIVRRLKKDLDGFARKDIEKLFLMMQKEGRAESSIATDKVVLKSFFKWLNNGEEAECTKWYKCSGPSNSMKLPEELLNQEEVKDLIKFAFNKRDKALIAVLWESGARIGEIGGMQVKNISFDEFGCRILVDGKTGMRRIRLINSAPYLVEWLNAHPNSNNPEAPLWISIEQNGSEQLTHRYIMKMLKCVAKRAKVKKPVNPHNFRHSRATYLSQHLTEALMKEYFGWVQDSRMAARYIHLSGKQVDDAILRLHGLKKEEQEEDLLKREPCPRCGNKNDPNNEICEKCWLPLKPSAMLEMEKVRESSDQSSIVLLQLLDLVQNLSKQNPTKLQEAFAELKKQVVPEMTT
ncbi:MAG: tyrosine-type recombinase/integrase [Candidatus Diapherotrites archaeon]